MTLAVAVLLIAGAILFPLLVRRLDLPEIVSTAPGEYLEARKTRIQEGLQDLEFEFHVGKLSEADYKTTREELERDLERVTARIGGEPDEHKSAKKTPAKAVAKTGTVCPYCGATFETEMKFCGECGKPMKGGAA